MFVEIRAGARDRVGNMTEELILTRVQTEDRFNPSTDWKRDPKDHIGPKLKSSLLNNHCSFKELLAMALNFFIVSL